MSNRRLSVSICLLIVAATAYCTGCAFGVPDKTPTTIKISAEPLNNGRITNLLYGAFIELLDDLTVGTWAEMLNDRGFEGVKPMNWCYYMGELNMCDREWSLTDGCSYDTLEPFNGKRSAKLTATADKPASIEQAGMSVKKGMIYRFTGNFKASGKDLTVTAVLKAELPDGSWMTLASRDLSKPSEDWQKLKCDMKCVGTTDRAVFELQVSGEGSLLADRISLMPSDNMNGWRKDVIECIKDAHPGVVRFGGSLHEFGYKWKVGVGDRDSRIPFFNQYWGRNDPNDIGIDEFLQFCKLVRAEPLMCVSFQDGPDNARDLVEYCNGGTDTEWGKKRAENGHPEPYNVKFWQIGNEQIGDEYARKSVEFCEKIKSADPNAIIIASNTTLGILKSIGSYISYGCHHYYYIQDNNGCEEGVIEDAKIINSAGLDHEVKTAITEWNITAADWGLGRGKLLTLQCGLATGRFMNVLHKHCDVVGIACRSNMANSLCSGYIQTNKSGLYKTPSYFVMKLYADHYKSVPVGASGVSKGIDLSACRSEDGKKLTVFVVNSKDTPAPVTLDLSAYGTDIKPGNSEMVWDTLDKRQPEMMNNWSFPDRIRIAKFDGTGDVLNIPAYSVVALEYVIN